MAARRLRAMVERRIGRREPDPVHRGPDIRPARRPAIQGGTETTVTNDLPDAGTLGSRADGARPSRLSGLLTVLVVAAGVACLAIGIGFQVGDLHVQTVLSGSMRPTVSPGDLAVTQGVPTGSLRVGDVIVFMPPDGSQPVLHRIASLEGDVITTKGDANTVADPWRVTLAGTTGYRMVFVVPFVGWLTQLRGVALIAAGMIVALLILLELRKGVGNRRAQVAS